MINWELPHEKVACPHCGSTETELWLQLLGVIRYSCNACRKSFANQNDTKTTTNDVSSGASTAPPETPALRQV
jgi:transposase-like protein